jgi:hypothetical protein
MNHQHIIYNMILERVLREARELLEDAATTPHDGIHVATVGRIGRLLSLKIVRVAALSSDTFFAFVVRGVHLMLCQQHRTPRELIEALSPILLDQALARALETSEHSVPAPKE